MKKICLESEASLDYYALFKVCTFADAPKLADSPEAALW